MTLWVDLSERKITKVPTSDFEPEKYIVVVGKADRPVYLSIHDEAVEIRDAGDVWGRVSRAFCSRGPRPA